MYAAILRELMAAGLSGEALAAAIERIETALKPKSGAERTASWRANRVTRDVTSSPTSPESPPAPPPKVPPTPPLNTPPQGSEPSVRPAARAPVTLELDVEVVDEDPKARLFRIGKTALVSFGVAEKRTGSLLGMWLKKRPDPVGLLAAIQFARDQNVADPVAYVSTLISEKTHERNGKTNLVDLAGQLADELRRAELAAGIGRPAAAV